MHSQNINNEHKNVDWNNASIIPGIHELNSTDNVKNGSEKLEIAINNDEWLVEKEYHWIA